MNGDVVRHCASAKTADLGVRTSSVALVVGAALGLTLAVAGFVLSAGFASSDLPAVPDVFVEIRSDRVGGRLIAQGVAYPVPGSESRSEMEIATELVLEIFAENDGSGEICMSVDAVRWAAPQSWREESADACSGTRLVGLLGPDTPAVVQFALDQQVVAERNGRVLVRPPSIGGGPLVSSSSGSFGVGEPEVVDGVAWFAPASLEAAISVPGVLEPSGDLQIVQAHPPLHRTSPLGWRATSDRLDPFAELARSDDLSRRERWALIWSFVAATGVSLLASVAWELIKSES